MLEFILIFILFMLASASVCWVMFNAIQSGEALGAWQRVLDKVYKISPNAERFLGGCYKCFSHLWGVFGFIMYFIFVTKFLDIHYGFWWVLIYIIFVPQAITTSVVLKALIDKLNEQEKEKT